MDRTAETSFEPLEYYKKLTNCLASKKNLKLNVSKLQGWRNNSRQRKVIPFTQRKNQQNFLDKYKEKRRQAESNGPKPPIENKKGPGFVLKHKEHGEHAKRKNDDSFILNLPDSMFKAHEKPDLSMFKPAQPVKKPKTIDPSDSIVSKNFTFASLFSTNFKPPTFSTPIDHAAAKPITSDPDEIQQVVVPEKPQEKKEQGRSERMTKFESLIDESAKRIDSAYFGKMSDPIEDILKSLNNRHLEATQTPRQSQKSVKSTTPATPTESAKRVPKWPVPVFYTQDGEEKEKEVEGEKTAEKPYDEEDQGQDLEKSVSSFFDEDKQALSLFETNSMFSFLDETVANTQDSKKEAPTFNFDVTQDDSRFLFTTSSIWNASNKELDWTSHNFEEIKEKYDEYDWLEEAFTSMDMSWGSESDFSMLSEKSFKPKTHGLQASPMFGNESRCSFLPFKPQRAETQRSKIPPIFRSPPKPNRFNIQENFSRIIARPKAIRGNRNNGSSWWGNSSNTTPQLFATPFGFF